MKRIVRISALIALGACASLAAAQPFPSRPVRFIVPVSPGGNLDNVTRAVAAKVSESLGRPVVVENRPGTSGIAGADYVAKSAPDGYTYLSIATTFTSVPALIPNVSYDPLRDFTGVSLMAWLPQILVAHPSVPAKNVEELIALARRQPGALMYGGAGIGATGHIAGELFNLQANVKITYVPYKGNAPALVDVLGGQITFMFDTISTSIPHVKSGKLKALGVTSPKRSPLVPEVPTIAEAALPGYEASLFNAIVAPAGTPRDIRARMHAEIARAVRDPELVQRFGGQGVEMTASASADECTALIKSEVEKYADLVKRAGIKPE
jgi:tripartite-type tricarboxylate transporter receptor subunit TctC